MSQQKIYLVGAGITGWEGFGSRALEVITQAEVLIGHQRHLDNFPDFPGEKQLLEDLSVMLEFLRTTDKRAVVLGSGDPNFFGIGRFLLRNLPKDRIEIFPNVTSVQYAFAHKEQSKTFIKCHSQELADEVIEQHIALYVNNYSVSLGEKGKAAIQFLLNKASALNNKKKPDIPIFL